MNAIGHRIIKLDEVPSTNSFLIELAREYEVPQGTIILTDEQTNGRGQRSNTWESEKGLNLTFSFLLYPHFLDIMHQFQLSKMVTLGISDVLIQYGMDDVAIKWPNDIYIGDNKICGILIENSIVGNTLDQSVVGVGLNVNQTKFVSDAPNPISIKQITGEEKDLSIVMTQLSDRFNYWYKKLYEGSSEEMDKVFEGRLYRKSGYHLYQEDGVTFLAKIVGINDIGQLVLEKENGEQKQYHFKEVQFLINKKSF